MAMTTWVTMNMTTDGPVSDWQEAFLTVGSVRTGSYLLAPPVGPGVRVGQVYPRASS